MSFASFSDSDKKDPLSQTHSIHHPLVSPVLNNPADSSTRPTQKPSSNPSDNAHHDDSLSSLISLFLHNPNHSVLSQIVTHRYQAQQNKINNLHLQLKTATELSQILVTQYMPSISLAENTNSEMSDKALQQMAHLLDTNPLHVNSTQNQHNVVQPTHVKTTASSKASFKPYHSKLGNYDTQQDTLLNNQISLLQDVRDSILQDILHATRVQKLIPTSPALHKQNHMLDQITTNQANSLKRKALDKPCLEQASSTKDLFDFYQSYPVNEASLNTPELKQFVNSLIAKNISLESANKDLFCELEASKKEIIHLKSQLIYIQNMSKTPPLPPNTTRWSDSINKGTIPFSADSSARNKRQQQCKHGFYTDPKPFNDTRFLQKPLNEPYQPRSDKTLSVPSNTNIQIPKKTPLSVGSLNQQGSQDCVSHADNLKSNQNHSSLNEPVLSNSFSLLNNLLVVENQPSGIMSLPVLSQVVSVSAQGTFSKSDYSLENIRSAQGTVKPKSTESCTDNTDGNLQNSVSSSCTVSDSKPKLSLDSSIAKLNSIVSTHNLAIDSKPCAPDISESAQRKWSKLFTKRKTPYVSAITETNLPDKGITNQSDNSTDTARIADVSFKDDAHSNDLSNIKDLQCSSRTVKLTNRDSFFNGVKDSYSDNVGNSSSQVIDPVESFGSFKTCTDFIVPQIPKPLKISGKLAPIITHSTDHPGPKPPSTTDTDTPVTTQNASITPASIPGLPSSNSKPSSDHRRKSSIIPTLLPSVKPCRVSTCSIPGISLPSATSPVYFSSPGSPLVSSYTVGKQPCKLTPYNYNPANGDQRYNFHIDIGNDAIRKMRGTQPATSVKYHHAHNSSLQSYKSCKSHQSNSSSISEGNSSNSNYAIRRKHYRNSSYYFNPNFTHPHRQENRSITSIFSTSSVLSNTSTSINSETSVSNASTTTNTSFCPSHNSNSHSFSGCVPINTSCGYGTHPGCNIDPGFGLYNKDTSAYLCNCATPKDAGSYHLDQPTSTTDTSVIDISFHTLPIISAVKAEPTTGITVESVVTSSVAIS